MSDELTVERIQELADSLLWKVTAPFNDREERWATGFAAGWNTALRQITALIDPDAKLATKPFHQRCVTAECPPGHEPCEWKTDTGKQIGTATCPCGWSKACKSHNAREHHDKHRAAEAYKATKATP